MAAAATHSTHQGSKNKLANAIEGVNSPAPSVGSGVLAESQDESYESPYIKELQKNIRNLNKKITNASKTDSLLRQHPDKSIDELVAAKVINADQKAQIEKKPALQAQLTWSEEHLAQYQILHDQYRSRAAVDKAELARSLETVRADAVTEAKAESQQSLKDNLLTLSQFLRLAAYRREEGSDPESDESQAIEGVLLAIYAGDEGAVSAMLKLVQGTDDKVLSVPGEELQTTFSVVKTLAEEYKTPFYNDGAQQTEDAAPEAYVADSIAAAAAAAAETTDLDAPTTDEQIASGATEKTPTLANNVDYTTNARPESHWDTENGLSASQEWVDVRLPREAPGTETEMNTAPVAIDEAPQHQNRADDYSEPTKQPTPAIINDGSRQGQRNKSRQEREGSGNWRGRGRGEYRGRGGHRGDGRGRGRGRGGISYRPRRSEEMS